MNRLRTPLLSTAIYILLLGVCTLSPAIVRAVFGYEVKDSGLLLVLSAAFWGSGMLLWGMAAAPEKHGELAWAVVFYLVIFIAFLLVGWAKGLYTVRNVGLPLIIDVALAAWIGFVKPRA